MFVLFFICGRGVLESCVWLFNFRFFFFWCSFFFFFFVRVCFPLFFFLFPHFFFFCLSAFVFVWLRFKSISTLCAPTPPRSLPLLSFCPTLSSSPTLLPLRSLSFSFFFPFFLFAFLSFAFFAFLFFFFLIENPLSLVVSHPL